MLSGMLCVWNGAKYLDACIASALPHLDELVIVEGRWQKEDKASTDGTIAILQKWMKEPKVRVCINRSIHQQNPCRDLYWNITSTKPGDWMIILDSDEFYHDKDWEEIKRIAHEEKQVEGYAFKNLVFVNDYRNCLSHGFFPRLVKLEEFNKINVNHVYHSKGLRAGDYPRPKAYKYVNHPHIITYHYSYVIPLKRFNQKVAQRKEEERPFAWRNNGTKIEPIDGDGEVRAGVKPFTGTHPRIIQERYDSPVDTGNK